MNKIETLLIKIDQFTDYIPAVSTVTNLVDLFEKYVLLPIIERCGVDTTQNRYWTHIKNKDSGRCGLLLIPVVGNSIIGYRDFRTTEPEPYRPIYRTDGFTDGFPLIFLGQPWDRFMDIAKASHSEDWVLLHAIQCILEEREFQNSPHEYIGNRVPDWENSPPQQLTYKDMAIGYINSEILPQLPTE